MDLFSLPPRLVPSALRPLPSYLESSNLPPDVRAAERGIKDGLQWHSHSYSKGGSLERARCSEGFQVALVELQGESASAGLAWANSSGEINQELKIICNRGLLIFTVPNPISMRERSRFQTELRPGQCIYTAPGDNFILSGQASLTIIERET